MARATTNRQTEQLSQGVHRERPTGAMAIESANARVRQTETLRKANVAASSAAVVLTIGGVDSDANNGIIMPRAGVILGITWLWSTVPTAGTASLQVTKAAGGGSAAGTGVGDTPSVLAVSGIADQSAEVAFAEGDKIGLAITTNAGFLPITADIAAQIVIRWNSQP